MGLAEPRKRLKISHDPNNLAWSTEASGFGQKILSLQGWKPGEGLGARNAKHFNSSATSKVNVAYKDDNLGLGARLKSKDVAQSRTGLDTLQGLLGRLNGKSEGELKKEVQKVEDRKLARWAQGKWGGVIFVPGGKLVQGDEFKIVPRRMKEEEREADDHTEEREVIDDATMEAKREEEKRRRKEKRRLRREVGKRDPTAQAVTLARSSLHTSHQDESKNKDRKKRTRDKALDPGGVKDVLSVKKKKRSREEQRICCTDALAQSLSSQQQKEPVQMPTTPSEMPNEGVVVDNTIGIRPRNGRHMIRSRNIQAKKMAFADTKMLDEIFMRKT